MKLMEKWKKISETQKEKDIEFCKLHPIGWKSMCGFFIFSFSILGIFMILSGAFPLVIIIIIFTIWFLFELRKIWKCAFPKEKTMIGA